MNKKIYLAIINLIFLVILIRLPILVDSWQPILFFVSILTIVHVFDLIFDFFNIIANKIITFIISTLVILYLITLSISTDIFPTLF